MDKKELSVEIGGREIKAVWSDLAEQSGGSVILSSGDTVVLATAVMSKGKREGIDFFPLTVDYEEKFYAVGAILGSRFMKREGRPSDEAVLSGRMVDRTIRPLFDQRIRNEVQVVITILSVGEYDPDTLAVNAASLALATSNIPWAGPVSAVRIIRNKENGGLIVNPAFKEREENGKALELLACGDGDSISMVEVAAREAGEEAIKETFRKALPEMEKLQNFQKEAAKKFGKEKSAVEIFAPSPAFKEKFAQAIKPELHGAIFTGAAGKEAVDALSDKWAKIVKKELPEENPDLGLILFEEEVNAELHRGAIEEGKRADGRSVDELRPLEAGVGVISPIVHGSGLFYRGGTHVLSVLTLGGPEDSQIIDGMEIQTKKRFMHHYNFPPFSTGEVGRMGGTNRRMVGHGALAEKALEAVIPPQDKFPYTIRVVSEVMASNGSSSMASVCASSLALMDGGVPISSPVAGIAMGLMMDEGDKSRYKILTDIQGPEDHFGDMDFKVAGTAEGVSAVQLDIKAPGIPVGILCEALEKAREARLKILETMRTAISSPRENISPKAPKIVMLKVKPDQIGLVIGGGGKTINGIKADSGASGIDIEDDGTIIITGKDDSTGKAKEMIEALTREWKPGDFVMGEVVKIVDFGAFVKIGPNTEGLVHISEISPNRIEKVEGVLREGDTVPVVVKDIDERGRLKLSIKAARDRAPVTNNGGK